jgi:hypothetical protein
MTRDDIERRLRTEPAPHEAGYIARPLPSSLAEARERANGRSGSRIRSAFVPALVSVVLLVIAATAVGAWLDGREDPVGEGPSMSSKPATPSGAPPVQACRSADFAVTSDPWDAAAGSRGTRVVFRVVDSVVACTLGGALDARITDAAGAVLVEASSDAAPATRVAGGAQLEFGVAWSNWCGASPMAPLELTVTLAGDDAPIPLVPPAGSSILVPPCMGGGQASNLSITNFEPSLRPPPEG